MKPELEKALELLKPYSQAAPMLRAAHSEIATALSRLAMENESFESAVFYALNRIKRDEQVRFHCGYGTEMFSRLAKSAALHLGQTVKEVEEWVFSPDGEER